MNDIFKYLYHKLIDSPKKWYPFVSVYYLTNACDFRCPYCSDGSGKPYYQLSNSVLPPSEVLKILKTIRKHTPYLVITGGEPLKYPDFKEVMKELTTLKFKNVVLTTNGYDVDKYIDIISQSVHTLVFSIDTLNETKADKWFGYGEGTFRKILANIKLAKEYPDRKYEILISSVATPDNISDLFDVYDFAKSNGFAFALAPQLEGVKANSNLYNNFDYQQLFNFLVAEKKKGANIFGTELYLEYMSTLKTFQCSPFTMLVVSPKGDVYYPCLEIGHYAGNLLQESNLHKIRIAGNEKFGKQPNCGNQCHSACALGFGLIFSHPKSIFREIAQQVKNYVSA